MKLKSELNLGCDDILQRGEQGGKSCPRLLPEGVVLENHGRAAQDRPQHNGSADGASISILVEGRVAMRDKDKTGVGSVVGCQLI